MPALRTTGDRAETGPAPVAPPSLLRWGAGAEDFSEIHHDDEAARSRGLPGAVVHGPLQVAILLELLRRGVEGPVQMTQVQATYISPAPVGEPLVFAATVVGHSLDDAGYRRLVCELRARRLDGSDTVRAEVELRTEDPADHGLPLERVRHAVRIGEVAGTFEYRVEANDLDRFAQAHERTADPSGRAPATYFGALDPVERRDLDLDDFLHELPFPRTGGGNAFNEVEYVRPLEVGDRITVMTRYTEVYEKQGSRGSLLFRVRENELRDAAGSVVATSRCGHVLGFEVSDTPQTGEPGR